LGTINRNQGFSLKTNVPWLEILISILIDVCLKKKIAFSGSGSSSDNENDNKIVEVEQSNGVKVEDIKTEEKPKRHISEWF
jgi:hypothetical protein